VGGEYDGRVKGFEEKEEGEAIMGDGKLGLD
jgi:hypothetical protein